MDSDKKLKPVAVFKPHRGGDEDELRQDLIEGGAQRRRKAVKKSVKKPAKKASAKKPKKK